MPFTQPQMDAVASYALDFYIKGDAFEQSIQEKPLLAAMRAKQKTFPGGKGKISVPVNGEYLDADADFFKGFSFDDTVTFQNPNSVLRAEYQWSEIHAGITVTFSELKQDGITVTDSAFGKNTTAADGREMTALTSLLDHKLFSMSEGWSRKFNEMLWNDGTQDSGKQAPGILAYIIDDVDANVTLGGINRLSTAWWRNRASLGINPGSDVLTRTLASEVRQLRRYGGKPDLILCGSDFLDALEGEIRDKSTYSQTGVVGKRDIGSPGVFVNGIGTFVYDPTLDDLQTLIGGAIDFSKRCYMIDTNAIKLHVMAGEDNKTHSPARPEDKYALYRSMTWTGGTAASRLNSSGVYSIA